MKASDSVAPYMTVGEFKALVNSVPPELDGRVVVLPEGFHSSWHIRWHVDGPPDGHTPEDETLVIFECD